MSIAAVVFARKGPATTAAEPAGSTGKSHSVPKGGVAPGPTRPCGNVSGSAAPALASVSVLPAATTMEAAAALGKAPFTVAVPAVGGTFDVVPTGPTGGAHSGNQGRVESRAWPSGRISE